MAMFPMTDLGGHGRSAVGTVAATAAASVNGTGIDSKGARSVKLILQTGAATGTPTAQTANSKLQSSATVGGTYADITGGAVTEVTADNLQSQVEVDISGENRFIRVVTAVVLTAGTSPTWPQAAVMVFGGEQILPVSG